MNMTAEETRTKSGDPFKVVSLFSGCGGIDLGLKQEGYEIERAATPCWELNVNKPIRIFV